MPKTIYFDLTPLPLHLQTYPPGKQPKGARKKNYAVLMEPLEVGDKIYIDDFDPMLYQRTCKLLKARHHKTFACRKIDDTKHMVWRNK
jgi:hypothetical protein